MSHAFREQIKVHYKGPKLCVGTRSAAELLRHGHMNTNAWCSTLVPVCNGVVSKGIGALGRFVRLRGDRWSGWQDSNLRPHRPERCALPPALHPDSREIRRRKTGRLKHFGFIGCLCLYSWKCFLLAAFCGVAMFAVYEPN